ncbi:uncharacterized protein V1510DRAFT_421478 [Dipodascopsis tothii]|uniref:uncharacterized protein n=1 Tax=Dipodascopsis tothii TaxID=44089 RepID=UPI0034CEED0C
MAQLWQTLTEVYPPEPKFTEKDLPDLSGKVYLVTGATSGIGLELARVLYWKNATVFATTRTQTAFDQAYEDIMATPARGSHPPSSGAIFAVTMDLSDLTTIKPGVDSLLERTQHLDGVWYNAGVMEPPEGAKTVQNYELQWGVNVVAHYVLNRYLTETIINSAQDQPAGSVRVVWVASDANNFAPAEEGINWDDINYEHTQASQFTKYGQSKAGDILLGTEFAQRVTGTGVLSLSLNPGHLKTKLFREMSSWRQTLADTFSFTPRLGAMTLIFAGFSPRISEKDNGAYFVPWGRFGTPSAKVQKGLAAGSSRRLWELLQSETEMY